MNLLFWNNNSVKIDEVTKRKEKTELIDVRTPNEFRSGHIGYAKNVPLNKIARFTTNKEHEIYVICQSGMRSKQAAKILRSNGYDAKSVRGGMNRWNRPVRKGK